MGRVRPLLHPVSHQKQSHSLCSALCPWRDQVAARRAVLLAVRHLGRRRLVILGLGKSRAHTNRERKSASTKRLSTTTTRFFLSSVKSKQQQRKESESELEERLNFKRLSVPHSLSLSLLPTK